MRSLTPLTKTCNNFHALMHIRLACVDSDRGPEDYPDTHTGTMRAKRTTTSDILIAFKEYPSTSSIERRQETK